MLYNRREFFRKFESILGKFFSFMTPNQITFLSILFSLSVLYFILKENFIFASLLLAITGFLDIIDGSVARYSGKVTKKGAYMDTIADRYSEFFTIAGLALIDLPYVILPSYFWIIIYLFGSLMTTYSKAAAAEKLSHKISGGFLERAERLMILFVGFLLAIYDKTYLLYAIIFLAAVSNITALQRIAGTLKGNY